MAQGKPQTEQRPHRHRRHEVAPTPGLPAGAPWPGQARIAPPEPPRFCASARQRLTAEGGDPCAWSAVSGHGCRQARSCWIPQTGPGGTAHSHSRGLSRMFPSRHHCSEEFPAGRGCTGAVLRSRRLPRAPVFNRCRKCARALAVQSPDGGHANQVCQGRKTPRDGSGGSLKTSPVSDQPR